jgi:alcohol dehydrogenase class IV
MRSGAYDFLAQERIIWGKPAAEAAVSEADRLGARRVFLVASRSLNRNTPVVAAVRDALDARCVGTFDECREHTPRDTVIAAAEAARAARPDLIISLGGGTVIDTVKVMLVCLAQDVRDVDAMGEWHPRLNPDGSRFVPAIKPPPYRQIAVPTTLSAAEFSNIGGCTDPKRKVKDAFTAREIGALAVIMDPAATLYTPGDLWFSTGIRGVDHAVEGICSITPSAIVDGTSLHALRLFKDALPRTRHDPKDLDARLACQEAAWLSGLGIGRAQYGASHGIGHSLGAVTGIGHGHTSCIMLPAVLAWNRDHTRERQAWIAEAFGRRDGDAAAAVAELVEALGQPRRLRDAGVKREQFPDIAKGALGNMWVRTNPRPIKTVDDVLEILEMAW